ncbi:MAG: hypothetical protein KAI83_10870 [Thiomargarita sp.]|nr:hypothetical protein [Thiomargarita sp.]
MSKKKTVEKSQELIEDEEFKNRPRRIKTYSCQKMIFSNIIGDDTSKEYKVITTETQ